MRRPFAGLGLAIAVALLGQSYAALGGTGEITTDEAFVGRALAQGLFEVKLSERAAEKAANADVRKFAQQMVNEHKKCNQRLMKLADGMKLGVVQGLDKDSKEKLARLGRLEGAPFDREYMQQQVKAHERAIKMFESRAKATTNAPVKTFINETLPHLREHLKEARAVAAKVATAR
jgi:putative membrane protein